MAHQTDMALVVIIEPFVGNFLIISMSLNV